ncbi:MAG: hypothetical protein JRI58_13735 [Deltaproteobacteria bacterium]|nr:hypothetical protein [Deltaproteobacteria bacterium]
MALLISHASGLGILGGVTKGVIAVLSILFSAMVGYLVGAVKSFRDEKQKAYGEILPPIVRMAYTSTLTQDDEKDFNKALAKLWLYANRDVAFKVDRVASILVDPSRGNKTEAIQQAIVAIRKDIHHKWPFSNIKPDEVAHLYMRIGAQ